MLHIHMNKKVVYLILTIIVIVAAVLRLYQLGSVPPSPDWDEAALGYNAYSILETGKDEYGKHLPVILRSFDDYKPALYAYLIIPLLLFFDLNTFVVRLPSALFGIIAVVATFFFVRELFREKNSNVISLLSAGLLAISPWHIQFSRIAFEAQVGLSFNILAMLFFVKGIKRPIFLTLATIFAGLSIYVYQSEKVYLPILFGIFTIIYWKQIWAIPKKWILIALFAGLVVVLPMAHSLVSDPNSLLRAKGVSVF